MKIKSIIGIFISLGLCVYGQNDPRIHSQCSVQNIPGVCKLAHECPTVLNELQNGKPYVRCGFEGQTEIVWCPGDASPSKDTTHKDASSTYSRISEQKCNEYKSAVYEVITTNGEKRIDQCIKADLHSTDENASPGEFPHMALLGFDVGEAEPKWLCGGTLISDEYVLTAAHCAITTHYGSPKYVRLGLHIINDNNDESLEISNVIAHPDSRPSSRYNDIALLKLNQKIKFTPRVRPACLPTKYKTHSTAVIGSAWGATEFNGNLSKTLQKIKLDIFGDEECQKFYKLQIDRKFYFGITSLTQICAVPHSPERDLCQGTAGSPLQEYHEKHYCMYTIIGIVSFGIGCGSIGVPGVSTRVYSYVGWIEGIVWGNNS